MNLLLYLCASQIFALSGLACIFLRELIWQAYTKRDGRVRPRRFDLACIVGGVGLLALAFGCVMLAGQIMAENGV
jgi:hypothetical protein